MDNVTRSERTRSIALQAALGIITSEGATKLTMDAIARESGISKGGVLHHFKNKESVLKALLARQIENGDLIFSQCLQRASSESKNPALTAQIMTLHEAANHPNSTAFALAGAMADAPELLEEVRSVEAQRVEQMTAVSLNKNETLLRWAAAKGLALSAMLGLCPLSDAERERLFGYLENDANWEMNTKKSSEP
ncbi:TetR/AcrR family transcriptional regulator [Acetobacter fabarum]|uniref:TetR/AcrR family transcriptional regulator n=1 Tax=Acetobacter fabarum TaxID=483199 RepID=UPI0039EC7A09